MICRLISTVLLLGLATAGLASPTPAQKARLSDPKPEATVRLKAMDANTLLAEDNLKFGKGQPAHYGKPVVLPSSLDIHEHGDWTPTADGRWIARLAITAPGATTLDIGFKEAWLPAGAELYFYDAAGALVRGPYSDANNKPHGQLWIPVVPGEKAIVELIVPDDLRQHVRLALSQVNFGFRLLNPEGWLAKSGNCNVDVVCHAGDGFRDPIRSAAAYGVGSSSAFCSGQMVNNTANDNSPYFLTANHCGVTENDAASLTLYWNYESDSCREPGTASSGTPLPLNQVTDVQTGATLVAESAAGGGVTGNDFSLILMDEKPDDDFGVFWAGWDRSGAATPGATTIHHPQGDEKRISHTDLPLLATGYLSETGGGSSHWRVRAWSVGTTEPGSSGSGLYDPDGRLVGTLSGGFASCSSNPSACSGATGACDWYGRFSEAFDTGTQANRRLSDWLDPLDSGETFIDGINSCEQPTVRILSSRNPARAGETVQFSARVTGGQAPYTLAWDVDGDDGIDSTETTVSATFPDRYSGNVVVSVSDSLDCKSSASFGQVITAPRIVVDSVAAPIEQCGDGDGNIEPGETWVYSLTLRNVGNAVLTGGIAAFAPSQGAAAITATDDFGYAVSDSSLDSCAFDFQDISDSGALIAFDNPDDAGTPVALGGPGFDFYGSNLTDIAVTTNGYLSSDPLDTGADFSNDCPVPAVPSSGAGARVAVLHDDLFAGQVHHQYLANCPRPGEAPGGSGCNIVQWSNMDYFDGGADATFQALLYDNSNQLVFQYLSGNPKMGNSQTVGIQNETATDGLAFSCNQPNSIPDNSSVCFFHPDAEAPSPVSEGIELDSPAMAIGTLFVSHATTVNVVVQIANTFPCGGEFALDYLGTADDRGFSNSGQRAVISSTTSQCDAAVSCSVDKSHLRPNPGFWSNPSRPGAGLDLHFRGDEMYGTWFTAESGRIPVWYYVQSQGDQARSGEQYRSDLLRFTNSGNSNMVNAGASEVGEAVFSFLDNSTAVMTWELNGQINGEKLSYQALDASPVNDLFTDQWFSPAEPGWGLGVQVQGNMEFDTIYLYGTDGEPRWLVTVENPLINGGSAVSAFRTHCPGCAYLSPIEMPAGSFSRILNTNGTGELDLDINLGGDQPIQWLRDDLAIIRMMPAGKSHRTNQ